MKKLLLSLITIVSMSVAIAQNCTADPQYTAPGVYPDSTTGLAIATIGIPYAETLTTITPLDTCMVILFPPCTVIPIDSVVIDFGNVEHSLLLLAFLVVPRNEFLHILFTDFLEEKFNTEILMVISALNSGA